MGVRQVRPGNSRAAAIAERDKRPIRMRSSIASVTVVYSRAGEHFLRREHAEKPLTLCYDVLAL